MMPLILHIYMYYPFHALHTNIYVVCVSLRLPLRLEKLVSAHKIAPDSICADQGFTAELIPIHLNEKSKHQNHDRIRFRISPNLTIVTVWRMYPQLPLHLRAARCGLPKRD